MLKQTHEKELVCSLRDLDCQVVLVVVCFGYLKFYFKVVLIPIGGWIYFAESCKQL